VECREEAFEYEPAGDGQVRWYLNLGDMHLFGYYGGPLFGSEEQMAAELPVLPSLREYLDNAQGRNHTLMPMTAEPSGRESPCLVRGCQRLLRVDVRERADAGARESVAGSKFVSASNELLDQLSQRVQDAAPFVNVASVEGPKWPRGAQTRQAISRFLGALYSAFRAIKVESYREAGLLPEVKDAAPAALALSGKHSPERPPTVVVHASNWSSGERKPQFLPSHAWPHSSRFLSRCRHA
jgi:hypothetical protein